MEIEATGERGIEGWLREREESVVVVAMAAGGRRRKWRKKKERDGGPAHSGTRAYEKVCGTPSRPTRSEYRSTQGRGRGEASQSSNQYRKYLG
jgi:hypothetical protein